MRIGLKPCAASPVARGASMRCSSRGVANRIYCGVQSTSMAPHSTSCCKSGATRPPPNASSACAAFEPGAAHDRHRSVAQLSGGESRDPGTCERQACVHQSCGPTEQRRREQPSTDARTRATHARFRDPKRTQKFLSCFGPTRQHFALERHLLRASLYRNDSQRVSLRGAKSPKSPEVRRLLSHHLSYLPSSRLTLGKLTKPLGATAQP